MYDICSFALRGRPFGLQHLFNIEQALEHGQYAFVFIGSDNEPINFRNPFTVAEVQQMIRGSLSPAQNDRVFLFGVENQDTDLKWVLEVQKITARAVATLSLGHEPEIALIGHSKDDSSYYLKMFPKWGSINTENFGDNMSATDTRNALFNSGDPAHTLELINKDIGLPKGTYVFLRQWVHTDDFKRMQGEYLFNIAEDNKFGEHPYNPGHYHLTADYCLFQAGRVALVKRGQMPGKGLWALPGGHLGFFERFEDAAMRELNEETSILACNPELEWNDLRQAIKGQFLLDDPWRSTRMRTVGMAFGAILPGTEPIEVKGADDAEEARMWNLDEVTRTMMFEDHFLIIQRFAGQFNI